jgi:Tol biopolymer transport system component
VLESFIIISLLTFLQKDDTNSYLQKNNNLASSKHPNITPTCLERDWIGESMNISFSKRQIFFAFALVLAALFSCPTGSPLVPVIHAQQAATAQSSSSATYLPLIAKKYPQEIAYLAWLDAQTTDVFIINSDGTGKRRLTQNLRVHFPECTSWSPSGGQMAFLSGYNIYRINADGTGLVNITSSLLATCFTWAPDSSMIIFVGWTACDEGGPCCDIFQVKEDGTGLTRLTNTYVAKKSPTWSPDGRRVAFVARDEPLYTLTIYVMNADGTGLAPLAEGGDPSWSPDGAKIAFLKSSALYTIGPDGTGEVQIFPRYVSGVTWSPDSSRLAFSADEEVYAMNADGSNLINLSNDGPSSDEAPTWSPDGAKVAFHSNRNTPDQSRRLYVVNADGSGLTPLTGSSPTSVSDFSPKWRPSGHVLQN